MAPTDGIRIWYANVMTYAFEHIFVWFVALAVLLGLMSAIYQKSSEVGTFRMVLVFLVSDALASCLVWWMSPVGSRPWPVATLWLYLTARWIWLLAASVVILLPYTSFHAGRRLIRRGQAVIVVVIALLAIPPQLESQGSSYYAAIQAESKQRLSADEFKALEEKALSEYTQPEHYQVLATTFSNTTEKVWAAIYGEIFCNLANESGPVQDIGAIVFRSYDQSLAISRESLSVSLTQSAEAKDKRAPFESLFEQRFLMGAFNLGGKLRLPLSIATLSAIRLNLLLAKEPKLADSELLRRQKAIQKAGHFEAYNYWLFQGARPEEFKSWLAGHKEQYQAWIEWRSKNAFAIKRPDFQRLYMLRN